MIKFFDKILTILKNFDFFLFLKLNLIILKKNYSKYPKYVEEFENTLANKFNFKYCLSFSSGTAAFYASILSLNLKRKSKVLISVLTFPSVIEILKKQDFDICYMNIDKNFKFNLNNITNEKYDLLVLTHPFGFYLDIENISKVLDKKTKIIFDSSHSQGIKIAGKDHMKFADISFMSLQGSKAISGGEGGVIFTDNQHLYLQMINNHHPGHKNNAKLKVAGGINDLKLRMHPLAAILAKYDLKKFENRNKKLIKKIKSIFNYLDNLGIQHPYNENSNIGGFHFGIPFFSKKNLSSEYIKKYNWYENLNSLEIKSISTESNLTFFKELYFFDLDWIKNNNIHNIKNEINKIFKDVN